VRFEAVIFDLDGTLADTLEDIADAMNRVLRREGLPGYDYAAYRYLIGKGMRNLVTQALPADDRTDETIERCLAELLADYAQRYLVKTRLYDGVAELLTGLRGAGIRLAVLSNKVDEFTRGIVDGLTHPGTFDVVMGARPGVPLKPDPSAALLVGAELGTPPEAIAYLGDSGVDMRTALAAGMLPVGASWGFRTKDELVENGARAVLDQPLDLLALRL
jgi:phosphoglycolate phosphatase